MTIFTFLYKVFIFITDGHPGQLSGQISNICGHYVLFYVSTNNKKYSTCLKNVVKCSKCYL